MADGTFRMRCKKDKGFFEAYDPGTGLPLIYNGTAGLFGNPIPNSRRILLKFLVLLRLLGEKKEVKHIWNVVHRTTIGGRDRCWISVETFPSLLYSPISIKINELGSM